MNISCRNICCACYCFFFINYTFDSYGGCCCFLCRLFVSCWCCFNCCFHVSCCKCWQCCICCWRWCCNCCWRCCRCFFCSYCCSWWRCCQRILNNIPLNEQSYQKVKLIVFDFFLFSCTVNNCFLTKCILRDYLLHYFIK